MKVIALNDRQRQSIIQMVKPQRNDSYSYQNLNLLTAVSDENNGVYLTETHYLSSDILRTGTRSHTHQYALLTPLGCFPIWCKEVAGEYTGVSSPLPDLLPDRAILELIQYYHDSFSERFRLKIKLQDGIALDDMGFTEWYLTQHYWKH